MWKCAKIGLLLALFAFSFAPARADERILRCELGIEGGCGYYMGDAAEVPFKNVREMYGATFRYHFDQRWSLTAQGVAHRITGKYKPIGTDIAEKKWTNQLINLDVSAEFNFFRFGAPCYDIRVKPITPYLMVGLGVCLHGDVQKIAMYIPFGIGLKWKFAPHFNLHVLLQNNFYFADNLENVKDLDAPYDLNGTNAFNNDLTTTISVGLTVEFAKDKKICRTCERDNAKPAKYRR